MLYFSFKLLALVEKSGKHAIGFAHAALCRLKSRLRAFLGVDVPSEDPFSRKGDVSRADYVESSANMVIHKSSP